jgi:hypothetical protein
MKLVLHAIRSSVCAILIASFCLIPSGRAQAEMVSTESYFLSQNFSSPRDRVMAILDQRAVIDKLHELGVSRDEAAARIASLSDAEITTLNQQLDKAPAGADAAGAILGVAFAVFLILLITDILCLTRVFKFTRCAGS